MRCCNPFFVEEKVRREAGPGRWLKVESFPDAEERSKPSTNAQVRLLCALFLPQKRDCNISFVSSSSFSPPSHLSLPLLRCGLDPPYLRSSQMDAEVSAHLDAENTN
eukprot:TRINITY_DN44421_c1_g1_i2.p3 TRINITY_DN44421_c1_g1~~TRINITY_DN44421_c1_g1_i2.p3  ORF type:complete len:107 (-),score=19.40 TRINITY_DN44421_c1_g1_i2:123-443(-)